MLRYLQKKRSLPWIVGLSLLIIVVCLWYRLWTGVRVSTRQFIAQEGLEIKETFHQQLSTRISILEKMSRHWQAHQRIYGVLSPQDWQRDVQSYYKDYPGYRAIAHINIQGKADWMVPPHVQLSSTLLPESLNDLFIGQESTVILKLIAVPKITSSSKNRNRFSTNSLIKQLPAQNLVVFIPLGKLGDRQEEMLMGVLLIPDFFDYIFKSSILKGIGIQVFFNSQEVYHHINPSIHSFIDESFDQFINQSSNQSSNKPSNQSSNQFINQSSNQSNNQGLKNHTSVSFQANIYDTEWRIYLHFPAQFGQQGELFLSWVILFGGIILAIGLGGLIYFAQTAYQKTQKISQINQTLQQEIQQRHLAESDLKEQQQILRLKIQQEQALRRVVGIIRNSLDLNQIFATAAAEIAYLLATDRADIVEYRPQESLWLTVAAYRYDPAMPDTLGTKIPDQGNTIADQLKKLQVVRLENAVQADDEINEELARSFPGSWLLIPLHVRGVVWGSLSLIRHNQLSSWSDLDEELALSVAAQLAIAIQQSQLHQQLQAFNTSLERQVHLHTLELQRALSFEATLKRITDKVRDSLDQNQILQTVVKELLDTLEVDCCNAVLYNDPANNLTNNFDRSHAPPQFQAALAYEATQVGVSSHRGNNLPMTDFPDIYCQLEQGQYTAFCIRNSSLIYHDYAMLACPIIDDHGLLGDLWLFKPPLSSFGEMEIRLLEQVANQCAIAIRQAQLYQAAQKQVTELERLNLLKDDFLSTISHELRTPIASIKIATDMIEILINKLGGFQGDLKVLETYVQILQSESQREEKLINDLLDLTRLESGTEPLKLISIKLQYWIPYITDTFVERAKSQQQQLFIEVAPDFPEITTDVSILERIITELLTNACKYTPAGGFILLTTTLAQPLQGKNEKFSSREQPHVRISIVNSGVEIPAEELERIFDKFYRIPNRDPWRYGGTGLGLALVRRLAQYLGATIEVESDFGRTCFTVDLGNLYPEEPE